MSFFPKTYPAAPRLAPLRPLIERDRPELLWPAALCASSSLRSEGLSLFQRAARRSWRRIAAAMEVCALKTTLGLPPEVWDKREALAKRMGWPRSTAAGAIAEIWRTVVELGETAATDAQLAQWAEAPRCDAKDFAAALERIGFVVRREDGRYDVWLGEKKIADAETASKRGRAGGEASGRKRTPSSTRGSPPSRTRSGENQHGVQHGDEHGVQHQVGNGEALSSGGFRGKSVLSPYSGHSEMTSESSGLTHASESPASLLDASEDGARDPGARARGHAPLTARQAAVIGRRAAAECFTLAENAPSLPDAEAEARLSPEALRCILARFPRGWGAFVGAYAAAKDKPWFRTEMRRDFVDFLKAPIIRARANGAAQENRP